ncbi:MAG: ribosome maturation factor RimM [Rickettsiales bacterium]|jgi:16S rRNA processing protein RimM|nr:ribosome maturation factor RimM [Rickettsiales bacterium]
MNNDLIYIAKILSSHGLKGCVKLASHTQNPLDIFGYKNIVDEKGNKYELSHYGNTNGQQLIACIKGIEVKEEADKLKNTRLYIDKKDLPALENDTFYIAELVGSKVKNKKNEEIGVVSNISYYGAGDILEIITLKNEKKLISFNEDAVLHTDLDKKEIVIDEEHLL